MLESADLEEEERVAASIVFTGLPVSCKYRIDPEGCLLFRSSVGHSTIQVIKKERQLIFALP
jgi:hypothetical protein